MESEESSAFVKQPQEPSIAPPSVGSDDEDSFVVLGTSSYNDDADGSINYEILPPIRSGKIHEMQNLIKMEISQINSESVIPDMPEAADTLNAVTSSVANITLSPDSSYEEIQKQVEELIKENEKLKNIIAQNNISMKTQYDRILAWKEEVTEVMQSYKTKFVEAKNYIDKCKEENSKLANDVEKYKKIKELQDEEIINLKRKQKDRENLNQVSSSAEQNMIQFDLDAANEKIKDLQAALAEANLLKAELTADNEKLTQNLVTASRQEQMNTQEKEIDNLKKLLATYENQEKSQSDYVDQLKKEIIELRLRFEKESRKSQELAESTTSAMSSYESIKQSNVTLSEEMNSLKAQMLSMQASCDPHLYEKYEQLRQQLMNSQMTITALHEEIKSRVNEIEELRALLQNASKSDEMYALKEQLEVYKTDFEAERESKNALKREKDQMAEDMQNLHKRTKQLQLEVEKLRGGPKGEAFQCPKCAFTFNNYQSLENHVHRCLDLDSFP